MRTCTHTKKRRRQTWRYLGTNYRLTEADRKIPESLMILSPPPPPFLIHAPSIFLGLFCLFVPGVRLCNTWHFYRDQDGKLRTCVCMHVRVHVM